MIYKIPTIDKIILTTFFGIILKNSCKNDSILYNSSM